MQKTLNRPKLAATKLTHERLLITPEIAMAWLDKNTNNRRIKQGAVDKYARDMLAGMWPVTGDPIRFDVNGTLVDGQHRLKACVKADVPFETMVVYGLELDAKEYVDIGTGRSVRDYISLRGIPSANLMAGAANIIKELKEN